MRIPIPHFLLLAEARRSEDTEGIELAAGGGEWRFVLEAEDGSTVLEAEDREDAWDAERLELLAVVRGLEALDQPSSVTLVTSSRYVSHGLRFGILEWRENDWCWERFGELMPVKNGDLWQRVDQALRFHQVDCRTWRVDRPHGDAVPTPRAAGRSTGELSGDTIQPAMRLHVAPETIESGGVEPVEPLRAGPLERTPSDRGWGKRNPRVRARGAALEERWGGSRIDWGRLVRGGDDTEDWEGRGPPMSSDSTTRLRVFRARRRSPTTFRRWFLSIQWWWRRVSAKGRLPAA